MTLCVAWRVGGNTFFASDSRISNGKKYSDYGIKIIPLPITIFEPSMDGNMQKEAFHMTYGMCFSGSFTGAYIIREFIGMALQKMQYIPNTSDLSFLNVCRIVEKFYKNISENIIRELDFDHSIDFFLSGFCKKENIVMTAKFYIEFGGNYSEVYPKFKIMDSEKFIEYIGSGDEKYKIELDKINSSNLTRKPLLALRNLINKNIVLSVGGNIQYGSFDKNNNFHVSGIVDEEYKENGLIDKIKYCYAGIDMNGTEFEYDGSGYFITGSYIDPFK
jgi:hypothetical protein